MRPIPRGVGPAILCANPAEVTRDAVMMGWLLKMGKHPWGRHWSKRYVVLRPSTLAWFKTIPLQVRIGTQG